MSLTETEKHWLWGCACATAASKSDVNVAIPHLRGKWSPTKAILRTLPFSFISITLAHALGTSCVIQQGPTNWLRIRVRGMLVLFLPLLGLLLLGRASFSEAAHVLFGEGQCAD